MPEFPERTQSEAHVSTAADRRRPGRQLIDSPHLIALLRNPGSVNPPPADEAADRIAPAARDFSEYAEDDDPLAGARGAALGVLIGAFTWVMIGVAVWHLL